MKGKLNRWNDAKGFGFIAPHDGGHDVFVHISALKKMARRPMVGDEIIFEVHLDSNGKKRAVNATIEGVSSIQANPHKSKSRRVEKKGGIAGRVMALILILGMGAAAYSVINRESASISNTNRSKPSSITTSAKHNHYRCAGKTHCSEMSSCDEARFYLENCPGVEIDGDRDGVPCERQLCGW